MILKSQNSPFYAGGGISRIRYALIGLAPYSFHYDLSRVFRRRCLSLPYLVAFNDLHNFFLPMDIYKKFLREEWLEKEISFESFNENKPYGGGIKKIITQEAIEDDRDITWSKWTWLKKYYPATRDENIKILDDYLTFCEENNIRPVMFMVPVTEKYISKFNPTLLEEFYILVEQALSKHPDARFLDGSKWDGLTYADFYDHEHLNVYGAEKFSAYLNDFIERLES